MTTHQTPEDDFLMAFVDSCDRPTLLLLHSYGLNSNMWNLQIDDFANFLRVVAPDFRGHGRSDPTSAPFSLEILADDSADLLGYLNVPTPFVLCGLSLGGYVALDFYRRYREHVGGLVLSGISVTLDGDERREQRRSLANVAQKRGAAAVANLLTPGYLRPGAPVEAETIGGYVQTMMAETSVPGLVYAQDALRERGSVAELLPEIDCPVLVIHGAEDQLLTLGEAEAVATAVPDGRLVVIPGAGHLVNLEQPDLFNDTVIDFVERLPLGLDWAD